MAKKLVGIPAQQLTRLLTLKTNLLTLDLLQFDANELALFEDLCKLILEIRTL